MADRFLIGPYNSGLVKDKKPFLIPDEAFSVLRNAYVWRSRVRKRFGSTVMNEAVSSNVQQLYTRFRVQLGVTAGGALAGNVRGITVSPTLPTSIGQLFSISDGVSTTIFTVFNSAAGAQQMNRTDGLVAVATYDLGSSAFNITAVGVPDGTPVYFYPALPVMGLLPQETASVNDEEVVGFDTHFAYKFNGASWDRFDPAYSWTGSDSQFFWAANWRGNLPQERVFFVTNYNLSDGIAYIDPTTNTFTKFEPYYINEGPGPIHLKVLSARLIIPFQERLVLLNTIEEVAGGGSATFFNRARWSQNGNPLDQGNPAINNDGGWVEPPRKFGRGDHIDAPTAEAIVTALILKDRLIVYFERSTWELVYTGNQVLPFVWQTINIELGAESTFSVVPFDKVLLGVGDVGIHACNAANVDRIDSNIPDDVFEIQNINAGPDRVYGIRDYATEMVYWAYPYDSSNIGITYPNRIFVYNYKNGSWAFNDDSITCFGQFQIDTSLTWNSTELTWAESDFNWSEGSNITKARNVIAGNQQGFVFILRPAANQISRNAHALSITNITEAGLIAVVTIVDHNLTTGDFILIDYMTAINDPQNTILQLNNTIFEVVANTVDTIAIKVTVNFTPGATYTGGGTARRVSQMFIKTKQYNFYLDKGVSFTTNKIELLVDKTPYGKVTLNTYVNSANIIADASILTTSAYDPIYAPMEQWQDSLWHSVYPNAFGSFLQFEITLTDEQMLNQFIADSDFVLDSMIICTSVTSSRLQ